jgi:hypothetical protein
MDHILYCDIIFWTCYIHTYLFSLWSKYILYKYIYMCVYVYASIFMYVKDVNLKHDFSMYKLID